jgi:sulfate permease, SulP family
VRAEASDRTGLGRYIPLFSWLPGYDPAWLSRDTLAGATLWGLLIPEMIAYAALAGLPPQAGLYTLLASLGLYAIFGTSRHLVVAATSASAILLASTVSALGPATGAAYMTLAAALVILVGLTFAISGLLRFGFIANFISKPVMTGFVFGLAIFVSVSQLPKFFGIHKGTGDTLAQLAHLVLSLPSASWLTFAIGIAALALLFGLDRFAPRLPGGLILLALGILVSWGFQLSHHGVAIVGKVPSGLPSIGIPRVGAAQLWVLLPAAVGLMLVMLSEALGAANTFAQKHRYRINPNQDMVAIGLANLGSGLLGGLPAGGSMSQTAVNDAAGARTELSPLIAAGLALVTVIALTPLFTDLPDAILAALIIHAVFGLMRVRALRHLYQVQPLEFAAALATLLGVVLIDVLPGLIIGAILSLVFVVGRASQPTVAVLGPAPGSAGAYLDIHRHPEVRPVPGVLIIRLNAALFYANADRFRQSIEQGLDGASPRPKAVIIDLDASDDLDATGLATLGDLQVALADQGVGLAMTHMHAVAQATAERFGLITEANDVQVFATIDAALDWATSRTGPPPLTVA